MVMMKLLLFATLLMVVAGERTWKVVQRGYSFGLARSLSFTSPQTGWMVGDYQDNAFILRTEDGGTTLSRTNMSGHPGEFNNLASISMFDDKHGVAGWDAVANFACGSYTNDGITWKNIINDGFGALCAVQDAKAPTPGVYILIGSFSHFLSDIEGIEISTDGGRTWTVQDWKQGIAARYGWFKDAKVGIVTGGEWPVWPGYTKSRNGRSVVQLNQRLHYDGERYILHNNSSPTSGRYRALIASTVDGGKSWKTMQNWTDKGVYFNQVSCVDERTCWTVAEGLNGGEYWAYIYSTTDGFATIQQQMYFKNGYLQAIQMVNATFGWAAGTDQLAGYTAHFFMWDGKTWTDAYQVKDFYSYDLSVIDSDYAYAVGVNFHHDVDLARFSPFN